jgi:SEC-C motif-containing protein
LPRRSAASPPKRGRRIRAALAACPCGRAEDYAHCCGAFHAGAIAADAEALMRSRYSAYVLRLEAYLLATWHASTRPATLEFEDGLRWLGLEVRRHDAVDATHASVEFVARYKIGGRAERLHETSRFIRQGGRWYYLDGDFAEKAPA